MDVAGGTWRTAAAETPSVPGPALPPPSPPAGASRSPVAGVALPPAGGSASLAAAQTAGGYLLSKAQSIISDL